MPHNTYPGKLYVNHDGGLDPYYDDAFPHMVSRRVPSFPTYAELAEKADTPTPPSEAPVHEAGVGPSLQTEALGALPVSRMAER